MSEKREAADAFPSASLVSPGLYRGAGDEKSAYEVKFLLTEFQAAQLEGKLKNELRLDPHSDPNLGDAYRVTSIYFDTADYSTYRRIEPYREQKYRIRRYGDSNWLYLERKNKTAKQVRKLRSTVSLDDLSQLPATRSDSDPAEWFVRQVEEFHLSPVCAVTYLRTALIGANSEGPIRATFDRRAFGRPVESWQACEFTEGAPLLDGEVIVELKFLLTMPVLFRSLVEELRILPARISKYRRCLEAIGQAPAAEKTSSKRPAAEDQVPAQTFVDEGTGPGTVGTTLPLVGALMDADRKIS